MDVNPTAANPRNLPSLPMDEVIRRGTDWFDTKIQPLVAGRRDWDCVAIDVLTGEFEVAEEPLTASVRLRERLPSAEIFMRRVGFPYVERIGYHPITRPIMLKRVEPKP